MDQPLTLPESLKPSGVRYHKNQVSASVMKAKLVYYADTCYLGGLKTNDCRRHVEIKRRMTMRREEGFWEEDWWFPVGRKQWWKTHVEPDFIWIRDKAQVKKLEAFEMWQWNQDQLRGTMNQTKHNIAKTMNKIGYTLCGNSLLKTVLEGRLKRKRLQEDQGIWCWTGLGIKKRGMDITKLRKGTK